MSSEPPAEKLTHEDFLPYQGRSFRVHGWDGTLLLAKVSALAPPGWPAHLRTPFTLLFHGARVGLLAEAIHEAQAEDGRRFTLHIMPVHTAAADQQDYQAVFN